MTLLLEPEHRAAQRFRAGQFMMPYRWGIGEIAVSVSGDPTTTGDLLEHTVRAVGAVSRALHDSPVGAMIGVRGPFGRGWQPDSAAGHDLVIVGGGVGLAPLRPLVLAVLAARTDYRRVILITGAGTPADLLFRDNQADWSASGAIELYQTVDQPTPGWTGPVGFVPEPLARLRLDPRHTTAFPCGPEPMLRFCAQTLQRNGIAAGRYPSVLGAQHAVRHRSMRPLPTGPAAAVP